MSAFDKDEDRPSFGSRMPESLAIIFDEVWLLVLNVHLRYRLLTQISQDDETMDLLNSCASYFFANVQRTFTDSVLLDICRLCDPHMEGKNENLSIGTLLNAGTDVCSDDKVRLAYLNEVDGLILTLQSHAINIRTVRHKRIAHSDLPTALRRPDAALPSVPKASIEASILLLGKIINEIETAFYAPVTMFDTYSMVGDGRALVTFLKNAKLE